VTFLQKQNKRDRSATPTEAILLLHDFVGSLNAPWALNNSFSFAKTGKESGNSSVTLTWVLISFLHFLQFSLFFVVVDFFNSAQCDTS